MIRILLLLFWGSYMPVAVYAYNPTVAAGKKWVMAYLPTMGGGYEGDALFVETILQDTLVLDDGLYMRLYEREYLETEPIPPYWAASDVFIRQDGDKVMLYNDHDKSHKVIMDFSLSVGDVFLRNEGLMDASYVVTAVSDTVLAISDDKVKRKCLFVKNTCDEDDTDIWVEGIGSLSFGITGIVSDFYAGAMPCLIECDEGNLCIYRINHGTTYMSLLEEGKQWVINRSVADLDNNITFEASGDSVLNGVHYTVIGNELLREEGAKVYVYDNFSQGEKVLYDFSLSVGDIVYNDLEEKIKLHVVYVDTIEVNGVSRKRIGFFTGSQLEYYGDKLDHTDPRQWANCWVEGIGGMYGPTDTFGWYIIGSRTIMQQCFVNNECVFTYDDFFTKPVSNISAITNIIDKSHEIYDLQGRKVTIPQRNRLYIKNGKKFVGN